MSLQRTTLAVRHQVVGIGGDGARKNNVRQRRAAKEGVRSKTDDILAASREGRDFRFVERSVGDVRQRVRPQDVAFEGRTLAEYAILPAAENLQVGRQERRNRL